MYAHISEPPPVVTEARPDLPAALDAVVAKAMAKEADDRYSSAGELAREAKAALKGPGPFRNATPANSAPGRAPKLKGSGPFRNGSSASAAPGGVVPEGAAVAGEDPWPRRRRVALGIALPSVLVAGLVAAGLAAAGVLPIGEGDPAPVPTAQATAASTAPPEATPTAPPTQPKAWRRSRSARGPTASPSVAGGCSSPTSRPGRSR